MEERKYTIWRLSPLQIFKLCVEILVVLAFLLPFVFPEFGAKVWNFVFDNFKSFVGSLNFVQ